MNHKLCLLNSQVFSFLYNQIFGDTTKIKTSYVYMEIVSGSNNRPLYPEPQVHVNIYYVPAVWAWLAFMWHEQWIGLSHF